MNEILMFPWSEDDGRRVLLTGGLVEFGRLHCWWAPDGPWARCEAQVSARRPFMDLLAETALDLIREALADVAPVLTAAAWGAPHEEIELFDIAYLVEADDAGRAIWRYGVQVAPAVQTKFDGRVPALAWVVAAATLRQAMTGISIAAMGLEGPGAMPCP